MKNDVEALAGSSPRAIDNVPLTAFHRVARGFVLQTGYVASRNAPLNESQQRFVRTLQPEFNDTVHVHK